MQRYGGPCAAVLAILGMMVVLVIGPANADPSAEDIAPPLPKFASSASKPTHGLGWQPQEATRPNRAACAARSLANS